MEVGGKPLTPAEVQKWKGIVERLRAEDLEDYEIYGCLAKFVSDNMPPATDVVPGGHSATVVSYLDKHGITVDEVLGFVNAGASSPKADSAASAQFAELMDYMENKGVPAEQVFECLEVFVESGGSTIYNAFGNLNEVDYFNYATVSGYLNSRGLVASGVKAFLQHVLEREPELVQSLKPSDDPSFTVQSNDSLAALADVYNTLPSASSAPPPDTGSPRTLSLATGAHSKEAQEGVGSYTSSADGDAAERASSMQAGGAAPESIVGLSDSPRATAGGAAAAAATSPAANGGVRGEAKPSERHTAQARAYEQDLAQDLAVEALQATALKAEVAELRAANAALASSNGELRGQVDALERAVGKLQANLDRGDAYVGQLAGQVDAAVAAAQAGSAKELQALRRSLQQLVDERRSLEDVQTYKFSAEEVEGLRAKLRRLHEKLQVNPSVRVPRVVKERQLLSLYDFMQSVGDAEYEVDRLREENHSTMKQLVMKKVELAETQEEVTKTKRALIRAVNKQMQLAYKLDELRDVAAAAAGPKGGNKLLSFNSRRHD